MEIIKVLSPINYEIRLTPTKTDVVHVSRLKRFNQRQPLTTPPTVGTTPVVDTVSTPVGAQPQNPHPANTAQRPTHRYRTRLNVRNALNLLTLLLIITSSFGFDLVEPVQWHDSERVVIKEITPYNFRIDYKSPCELFQTLGKIRPELTKWCDTVFNESFLIPLQKFCQNHDVNRHKRVIPVVIPLVPAIIGGVADLVTGAGIGTYFVIANTKAKVNDLIRQLDMIKETVSQGLDASNHIKSALRIAGREMNRTQLFAEAEINNLKSDVTVATYLAVKMAEIKNIIDNSANKHGYFGLTEEFLNIFNTSLPCKSDCPTNMTTMINCHNDLIESKLTFGVLTRKPSKTLRILKSDTFSLYNRTGIKNCYKTYAGPEYMLFDTDSNCIIPVPDFEKSKFVPYTRENIECDKSEFQSIKWSEEKCSVEHHFESIQFKRGHKFNYIYCFEQNITIKGRSLGCPNQPFRLLTNTSFSVEKFVYDGHLSLNITPQNYFWSDITNKFLTHVQSPINSSLDDYLMEIGKIKIPDLETMKSHSFHTILIVAIASGNLIFLSLLYTGVRIYFIRKRERNFGTLRYDIAQETARQLVQFINTETPAVDIIDIDSPD